MASNNVIDNAPDDIVTNEDQSCDDNLRPPIVTAPTTTSAVVTTTATAAPTAATLNAMDEYDIRDTFQALDSDQDGSLTLDEFHTLYLGLGYRPQRLTREELGQELLRACRNDNNNNDDDNVDGSSSNNMLISVEDCLQVLKKFPRNNRPEQMEELFESLLSSSSSLGTSSFSGTGCLLAADLQRLGQELAQKEEEWRGPWLSERQAQGMVALLSGQRETRSERGIDKATFVALLSPPEP